MPSERQQILILHLAKPELGERRMLGRFTMGPSRLVHTRCRRGDQAEPPYASVLDAMHDGWRVIQFTRVANLFQRRGAPARPSGMGVCAGADRRDEGRRW